MKDLWAAQNGNIELSTDHSQKKVEFQQWLNNKLDLIIQKKRKTIVQK